MIFAIPVFRGASHNWFEETDKLCFQCETI